MAAQLVDHLSDVMFGGPDNDRLFGGPGTNQLAGDSGDDRAVGGPGSDLMYGNAANDTLLGRKGNDSAHGGPGDDLIKLGSGSPGGRSDAFGEAGNDRIVGGSGSKYEQLEGGIGDDTIFGRSGIDVVVGSSGNDVLYGGAGDDIVVGGAGYDTVNAKAGQDSCDQDGSETPTGCEEVTEQSYRTVQVHATGTGTDPTGSNFGDPFFAGSKLRIYQIYRGNPISFFERVADGAQFEIVIPNDGGSIEMRKPFVGDLGVVMAFGDASFPPDETGPIDIVMDHTPLHDLEGTP